MNFMNQCRTCLSVNKETRLINAYISISGQGVKLSDILETFYSYKVQEDDLLPQIICINCVHHLVLTYSFNELVKSSAKTLSDTLTTVEQYELSNNHYELEEEMQITKPQKRLKFQRKHRNIDVESETKLFCVECKAKFHDTTKLNEHYFKNHALKCDVGRDCDFCPEKFDDFRSLVLHRKLHLRPYVCENCWKGFFEARDLNSHSCQPNVTKCKNNSDRFLRQCDQCGKSYPPGYIRVHMLTHSDDRPYSCKFCSKRFKVPGSLHSHILWNHKRTRNHKCEVCNATFISSSSKSSHIRKNHLKEKKYGCENCGKRFFSKSELQRHSLTHTGMKNFHCHLCDKSYQTRYGLNVHLKSHSQNMSVNLISL